MKEVSSPRTMVIQLLYTSVKDIKYLVSRLLIDKNNS